MGYWSKILKSRKQVVFEKQDLQPLGIIAGASQPDTLQLSIDRILNGKYGADEFERLRGFQFDTDKNEDEWADDEDFNENMEDDKGYFIDNKPEPPAEKVEITKAEYEELKKATKSKKGGNDNGD